MKMKNLLVLLVLFSPLIGFTEEAPPAAPAAAEEKEVEYKGEALLIKKKLVELFEISKQVNTAATKTKARAEIESALDWDKISELCLGKERAKKNAGKNFDEFKGLLKDVIIKTAYTRLDKFWKDTTYKVDSIEIKGNEAKSATKFFVKNEPFVLEYFLYKRAGKWIVYDISYEDLRYSININEQIDAFLKEKSFPGLIEKLKKRRAELDDTTKKG